MTKPTREIVFDVREAEEGGYNARALGYAIFTQGDDENDLQQNVREAVECHFPEGEAPRTIRLQFIRDEVIAL